MQQKGTKIKNKENATKSSKIKNKKIQQKAHKN